jgi:hypothetical protein
LDPLHQPKGFDFRLQYGGVAWMESKYQNVVFPLNQSGGLINDKRFRNRGKRTDEKGYS